MAHLVEPHGRGFDPDGVFNRNEYHVYFLWEVTAAGA